MLQGGKSILEIPKKRTPKRPVPIIPELKVGEPALIDGLIIHDYMVSEDLNECVDSLIHFYQRE